MKKIILLVVLAILAVVMYLTNPIEEVHRKEVKELAQGIIEKKVNEFNEQSKESQLIQEILKLLNSNDINPIKNMAIGKVLSGLSEQHIEVKNYYLFSVTMLNYKNEKTPIGIGVFKHIFFHPQIKDKLEAMDISEITKALD